MNRVLPGVWMVLGASLFLACGGPSGGDLFGKSSGNSGPGGTSAGGSAGSLSSGGDMQSQGGSAGTGIPGAGTGGIGTAGTSTAGTDASGGTGATAGTSSGGGSSTGGAGGVESGGGAGGSCDGAEICNGVDDDCSGDVDDGDTCPEGCIGVADDNGHGYMICGITSTFDDARAACQAESETMDLITIESEDENNFIAEAAKAVSSNSGFWMGATDTDEEDQWYWLTGQHFYDNTTKMAVDDSWINWMTARPNNVNDEDCAAFFVGGDQDGKWNDLDCVDVATLPYYVCEEQN